MFNREIEALLKIIALSIFADKRVLSTEITAFVESASVIQRHVNSDIVISETKLLLWFELNRAEIQDKMTLGPVGFKRWFEDTLSDLPVLSDKSFISEIIGHIANADEEFHISEKALGVMLERRFGTPAAAA